MGVLAIVATRSIVPLFVSLTTILGCAKLALETYQGYEAFVQKRQKEKDETSNQDG
jgi:hypothetical protein